MERVWLPGVTFLTLFCACNSEIILFSLKIVPKCWLLFHSKLMQCCLLSYYRSIFLFLRFLKRRCIANFTYFHLIPLYATKRDKHPSIYLHVHYIIYHMIYKKFILEWIEMTVLLLLLLFWFLFVFFFNLQSHGGIYQKQI